MSKALKIILYALVPHILIAVVIAAWIAFSPAPRYVQQPIFTDVSKIEVRYEDRVVRELTGRSEIAQVLRFLNSRRDGWSTSQPPRRRSSMEVVLFRTSGSKLVLEIQGYTWFIAQDESVFSRLFSSRDLLQLTDALGFKRPAEEKIREVQDQAFDRFIEIVTATYEK